jgi:transglutaminase-like putative cysteine protease
VRYQVIHQTVYNYESEVSISHHLTRLTPRARPGQTCASHSLQVEPAPAVSSQREDYFGNSITFLTLEHPHRQLNIRATNIVDLEPRAQLELDQSEPWEQIRDCCRDPANVGTLAPSQFVFRSVHVSLGKQFSEYAEPAFPASRPLLEAVNDLNARIFSDFQFDASATTVATPLDEVLKRRRGVCQDFAHFQIACLRSLGLPARYVSGYLETLPPPGKPKLVGSDASHAWTQVWCGPLGWVDFDPTNNLMPTERHITLGWGRDYNDVCPVRGVIVGGGNHQLAVAVDVLPMEAGEPREPG